MSEACPLAVNQISIVEQQMGSKAIAAATCLGWSGKWKREEEKKGIARIAFYEAESVRQFKLQLVRSLDNRDTFTDVFGLICVIHARHRVGDATCVWSIIDSYYSRRTSQLVNSTRAHTIGILFADLLQRPSGSNQETRQWLKTDNEKMNDTPGASIVLLKKKCQVAFVTRICVSPIDVLSPVTRF